MHMLVTVWKYSRCTGGGKRGLGERGGSSADPWHSVCSSLLSSALWTLRALVSLGPQFHFLSSWRSLGSARVPPHCTVQEGSLDNHRAHFICVPSLNDYSSSLMDVQCFESHYFPYYFWVFLIFSHWKINSVLVTFLTRTECLPSKFWPFISF